MSGGARKDFLEHQCIARISEAGDDVVMGQAWIIGDNIGFGPTVGHQPDDKLDGQPRARTTGLPART